jgi:O-acetyl-ADP-ribose deacetylase (regulator of RNase III)
LDYLLPGVVAADAKHSVEGLADDTSDVVLNTNSHDTSFSSTVIVVPDIQEEVLVQGFMAGLRNITAFSRGLELTTALGDFSISKDTSVEHSSARHVCATVPSQDIPACLPPMGVLIEIGGDILMASESFIVHQCNCVCAGGAQGVAKAIFRAFPHADVYNQRLSHQRPHDVPGTLSVHDRIVNFYSQLLPGKPHAAEDTYSDRLTWFKACLALLPHSRPGGPAQSVAFPAHIGCGLAGGHWPQYRAILERFAQEHSEWRVVLHDLDKVSASRLACITPDFFVQL